MSFHIDWDGITSKAGEIAYQWVFVPNFVTESMVLETLRAQSETLLSPPFSPNGYGARL